MDWYFRPLRARQSSLFATPNGVRVIAQLPRTLRAVTVAERRTVLET